MATHFWGGTVVRLMPLGGANEIGGSCMLLEIMGARIVIDAGLRPGAQDNRYPDFGQIEEGGVPDALLLTHAHVDHTGGLPIFHRRFPSVRAYATPPTIRIARTILEDSVSIMERDRDWEGDVDFTREEVAAMARAFTPVAFRTPTIVAARGSVRVTAEFVPAGHILGAAMIAIEAEDLDSGQVERTLISGDISTFEQPTIPGVDVERVRGFRPSLFVCEGTYGADEHEDFSVEEARFVERVAGVLDRGGKVLIPAFAVGRAQNVALILRWGRENPDEVARLLGREQFSVPDAMVFIDGMCRAIADQYSAFRDLLNPELLDRSPAEHVFYDSAGIVRPVTSSRERQTLIEMDGPMVFIASSGMLTGGASVSYAQALAGDERNAILLCGYQDEESPGWALRKMTRRPGGEAPTVTLGGQEVAIECEVAQYNLSAHSDAQGIEDLVRAVEPARVVLVHGTPARLAALQVRLEEAVRAHGMETVVEVSHKGEAVEVARPARARGARFSEKAPVPDTWEQRVLTGRASHGHLSLLPTSAWVTAALRHGRRRALSVEEVARLETLMGAVGVLGPGDVAGARAALTSGEGVVWQTERVGKDMLHVAGTPERDLGIAALAEAVKDRVVHAPRRAANLDAHWVRVRQMGVRAGDLILFLAGSSDNLRLLPAVTVEEVDYGFNCVAPGVFDGGVAVNQIVSKVGAWPEPVGLGQPPSLADIRLLGGVEQALGTFALQQVVEEMRGREVSRSETSLLGKGLAMIWSRVVEGQLSREAATLGSLLLVRWGDDEAVGLRLRDLADLMQEPEMLVSAALGELVQGGYLSYRLDGERLVIEWTEEAFRDLSGLPDADLILAELGPSFETLLRRAFLDSIEQIQSQGLGGAGGVSYPWLRGASNGARQLTAGAA